jgi:hypothetical protein
MAAHISKWKTEDFYRNHRLLARTEKILGLEVFILRSQKDQNEWIEFAYSPKTGNVPLKFVHHHSDGRELVVEPIRIEFR